MIARRLIVLAAALLIALQVVRNAAVNSAAALQPAAAAKLWPGHPAVEISLGLTEIGTAAREHRQIDPRTFAMIHDAAVKSPLAPEPFLVRGVQAQMAGDAAAAFAAFSAAQKRDPRSLPAAYFLADYHLRLGQVLEGLQQTALLARLAPRGVGSVTPFLAAYARQQSNWPQLRALFRSQPALEDGVLFALAADAANADAVLALASPQSRRADSSWVRALLSSLVTAGDYGRAYRVWASVSGPAAASDVLIRDADFSNAVAPPPFNWALTSSVVGLAERQPDKRLHLIFYGNQDGVLAKQLLLLPAGAYRMQLQLSGGGSHPEALRWTIRCDKSNEPLATAGVDQVARAGWTFNVPGDCAAQWLELSGRSGDVAQQSDVTISGLSLTKVAAGA